VDNNHLLKQNLSENKVDVTFYKNEILILSLLSEECDYYFFEFVFDNKYCSIKI